MMDDCEKLAEIEQLVDELADRVLCGAVVLVEGKRDKEALETLGIKGDIVMTSQKQLLILCEELARAGREVIVLTDWDERGEEVSRQIKTFMEADGGRPDFAFRDKLRPLVRKEIKDVESLAKYLARLRKVCASKPQPY